MGTLLTGFIAPLGLVRFPGRDQRDGRTMGAVFDVKKEVRWVTADAPRPISRFHKEICL
jgi:hypothetical protein